MCRGRSISFSMYTLPQPKTRSASARVAVKRRDQLGRRAHDLHSPPAAAFGGLDQDRKANFGSGRARRGFVVHQPLATWNHRHPRRCHFLARAILLAHHPNYVGRGSDKGDVRGLAHFREVRVFRKEAVPRMDGVDVGNLGGANDLRDVQVTFGGSRRSDAYRFIRKPHVQRIPVRLRIYRHRLDAQLPARSQDAQRNLAPIRDQNLSKHWPRRWILALLLAVGMNAEERFAILDRLPVFHQDANDFAGHFRFDLVHQLHRFDDAQHLALLHTVSRFHERWGPGSR